MLSLLDWIETCSSLADWIYQSDFFWTRTAYKRICEVGKICTLATSPRDFIVAKVTFVHLQCFQVVTAMICLHLLIFYYQWTVITIDSMYLLLKRWIRIILISSSIINRYPVEWREYKGSNVLFEFNVHAIFLSARSIMEIMDACLQELRLLNPSVSIYQSMFWMFTYYAISSLLGRSKCLIHGTSSFPFVR